MQTFVIKMPITCNFTISHASVNCYTMKPIAGCDRVIHLVDYLYNTTAKVIDRLNRTLDSVHKLISHFSVEDASFSNRSRVERGLLNLVGELSYSLLDTARDKDIAQLHAAIKHFAKNQNTMTTAWRQSENRLASLTQTVNHRLDHMTNLFHIERQTQAELYRQINYETTALNEKCSIIALALVKFDDLVILMDNLESFYQAV